MIEREQIWLWRKLNKGWKVGVWQSLLRDSRKGGIQVNKWRMLLDSRVTELIRNVRRHGT
jgi:hypothetical protein